MVLCLNLLFNLENKMVIGLLFEPGIVHYQYMALAKKTSVLREAML